MIIKIKQPQAIWDEGQRGNQEDTIFPALGKATTDDRLFVVCDGMGGHEHGEVASGEFTKGIADYFARNIDPAAPFRAEMLANAIAYAYQILDKADDGNYKKMGTTLTLIYIHHGGVTAAHIGDSRIYHIRPGKEILYVSRDHSLVFDLYQSGEISLEEMKNYPRKNVITRAVQPGEENRVRPDVIHITDIEKGDYFYLCSDGMLEQMDDDEILRLFSSNESNEVKRQQLIDATVGNSDNHSAYLIQVEDVQREQADSLITGNEEKTSRYNALNIKPAVIDAVPSNEGVVVVQQAPVQAEPVAPVQATPVPSQPVNKPQPEPVIPLQSAPVAPQQPEPIAQQQPESVVKETQPARQQPDAETVPSRKPSSRLWILVLLALAAVAVVAYLMLSDRNKKEDAANTGNDTITMPVEPKRNEVREVKPEPPKNIERHIQQESQQREQPQPQQQQQANQPQPQQQQVENPAGQQGQTDPNIIRRGGKQMGKPRLQPSTTPERSNETSDTTSA